MGVTSTASGNIRKKKYLGLEFLKFRIYRLSFDFFEVLWIFYWYFIKIWRKTEILSYEN